MAVSFEVLVMCLNYFDSLKNSEISSSGVNVIASLAIQVHV